MKTIRLKHLYSLCLILLGVCHLSALPYKSRVSVSVAPTRANWTYGTNEPVQFNISVFRDNQLLPNISANYSVGPIGLEPVHEDRVQLESGTAVVSGGTLDQPGFLTCRVTVELDDNVYTGIGSAAVAPEKIQPIVEDPGDFDAFWESAKATLKGIPIDPIMTLIPEQCTSGVDVYNVRLDNISPSDPFYEHGKSSYLYGILSCPKSEGPHPAILQVPGAGVRGYRRDDRASMGVIVFTIGIHGIPVNYPAELYESLGKAALDGYWNYGLESKETYYYRRVYLGCVRAVDFITSLPGFDGENLAVCGGSQGGALSIVTAALDDRVKYLAAFYPALSDLTAYTENRAGGWPHTFRNKTREDYAKWFDTISYYDVVNFAKRLKQPGWYSWGYNDTVCHPTSMYAAYNSISALKELHPFLETGHWTFPEQTELCNQWLFEKLGVTE